MIKQMNLERGEELTAVEKYELEKQKSVEFLKYLECNGMQVIEETSKKKKKKITLQENVYIRDKDCIYQINHCMRDLVFVKNLLTDEQTAIKQRNDFICANSFIELLEQDDLLFLKLENGIIRKFYFYRLYKTKSNKKRFTAIDLLDGEAMEFDEWQIVKIIKLKGQMQ